MALEESGGLEQASPHVFLRATGEAERCDSEHVGTGIGNEVFQLLYCACVVISIHCCITLLNQNPV